MPTAREPLFIIGCGDIGQRLAQRLLAQGEAVRGVVRSAATAAELQAAGIATLQADLDGDAALPADLITAQRVFWFAPPPNAGATDPRLRRWLSEARPQRLVYISTTGVYGDCQGRWIDEDESLKPQTDRARRRLDAEAALTEHAAAHGSEVVTLRVPGIYGPGRMPRERLRQNLPLIREDECPPTNRIHADDLADAALAALARGRAGAAYNIADGHPTTMTDYFVRCARLLGLPEPPRVTLDEARRQFTPAMMSFLEEPKRLITQRMREELGFTPRYPHLEAGLAASL